MIPGMNKRQIKQMERQLKKKGMKKEDLTEENEVTTRVDDTE